MEATAVEAKEATGDGGDSGRGEGGDRRRRRQRRGVRRRRQRHTGSLDAKQQTVQGMDDPKMVAMTTYGWRRALEDDRGLTTEVGGGVRLKKMSSRMARELLKLMLKKPGTKVGDSEDGWK